jgi:hypothetical protein
VEALFAQQEVEEECVCEGAIYEEVDHRTGFSRGFSLGFSLGCSLYFRKGLWLS